MPIPSNLAKTIILVGIVRRDPLRGLEFRGFRGRLLVT